MAKEAFNLKNILVALSIVAVLGGAVGWGVAFGGIREKVKANTTSGEAMKTMSESNKTTISIIREEQAYQKGVVNTKLDNLETGQKEIMEIIQQWEPQ